MSEYARKRRVYRKATSNALARAMPDLDVAAAERIIHAIAICAASMAWKGEPGNVEGIMNLADEFADYISGVSGAKIPRPDITEAKKAAR